MENQQFYFIFIMCICNVIYGQKEQIRVEGGCNFFGTPKYETYVVSNPNKEMISIWNSILDVAGEPGVYIRLMESPNVSNAMATIDTDSGIRNILFNRNFVDKLNSESATRWSSIFLLAHELGHHFYEHSMNRKKENSHKEELEADDFAARILMRLGADSNETVAAIATFIKENDEGNRSHPAPHLRIDQVSKAWQDEIKKQNIVVYSDSLVNKAPLILDKRAFKNPWTIISEAKATIDNEKVEIIFNIPPEFSNNFKACIFANSTSLSPGRNAGSLKGIGGNRKPFNIGDEGYYVLWNYKIDRYTREQVDEKGNLRFYVFHNDRLPQLPNKNSVTWGSSLTTTGVSFIIWGVSKISTGLDIYNNEYRISFDPQTYEKADEQYFTGQIITYTGIGLAGIGTYILLRRNRRNNEYKKCNCFTPQVKENLQPFIGSNGMGIKWNF
ncbi:MAG: hypothetical protein MI974_08780 [Chitinophagales bacterium]|nr:hypothetical protein [Chitinophagales bacterium]